MGLKSVVLEDKETLIWSLCIWEADPLDLSGFLWETGAAGSAILWS